MSMLMRGPVLEKRISFGTSLRDARIIHTIGSSKLRQRLGRKFHSGRRSLIASLWIKI